MIETSFEICTHCGGAGVRRSTDSTALHLLRAIEEEGIRRRSLEAIFQVPTEVALYLLNHKREMLAPSNAGTNSSGAGSRRHVGPAGLPDRADQGAQPRGACAGGRRASGRGRGSG